MIAIELDLLSGKVVQNIEYKEVYSGKALIINFEDGSILLVDSVFDGGVYAIAQTPEDK